MGLTPYAFSLEGHMEDQGTSDNLFLCVNSSSGKKFSSENLIKIGFSMVSRCCMSSMAFKLWSFIFRMFGVQWVLLEKDLNLLYGWWIRGSNSDI